MVFWHEKLSKMSGESSMLCSRWSIWMPQRLHIPQLRITPKLCRKFGGIWRWGTKVMPSHSSFPGGMGWHSQKKSSKNEHWIINALRLLGQSNAPATAFSPFTYPTHAPTWVWWDLEMGDKSYAIPFLTDGKNGMAQPEKIVKNWALNCHCSVVAGVFECPSDYISFISISHPSCAASLVRYGEGGQKLCHPIPHRWEEWECHPINLCHHVTHERHKFRRSFYTRCIRIY